MTKSTGYDRSCISNTYNLNFWALFVWKWTQLLASPLSSHEFYPWSDPAQHAESLTAPALPRPGCYRLPASVPTSVLATTALRLSQILDPGDPPLTTVPLYITNTLFSKIILCLIMSPLRRYNSFAFMAKWEFFGPSSVKRGRTHIVFAWNM